MIKHHVPRAAAAAAALFLLGLLAQACGGDGAPSEPPDAPTAVGPGGGIVRFADGAVTVAVPPTAVVTDVVLTANEAQGPANPRVVPGSVWELGPDGTQFNLPVAITITYDPERVPDGVDEADLRLHVVTDGAWTPITGSLVNVENNAVVGAVRSFSIYGAVGLGDGEGEPGEPDGPDEPGPAVGSVELSSPVQGLVAGGEAQLDATVRDTDGNVIPDADVSFASSDGAVATVDAAGRVTGVAPGTVEITATADGRSATVTLTVTIDWPAYAGRWEGEWVNTTFGSTGAITADLTIDVATLSAVVTLDVDGFVFGVDDPMPTTIQGALTPNSIMVDHEAPLHGPIRFDLMPGTDFMLESETVPADGIDAWDFEGRYDATALTGDFTVFFSSGGTADGTIEVNKS